MILENLRCKDEPKRDFSSKLKILHAVEILFYFLLAPANILEK